MSYLTSFRLEERKNHVKHSRIPSRYLTISVSGKYTNQDATPEERGSAEERIVIVVKPERVIVFPSEDKR
jgi:hypothetical protein